VNCPGKAKSFVAIFPVNEQDSAPAPLSAGNVSERARQIAELTPAQHVQLGTYDDVEEVSESAVNDTVYQTPHQSFNMEPFVMSNVLNREYQETVSWGVVNNKNSILWDAQFPAKLTAQTFINDKLLGFRYFRAGLRLTFRVTANKYLYGRVMVFANPCSDIDTVLAPTSVEKASVYPHVLVSASASEAVIFDLPFICPERAILAIGAPTDCMWNVKIMVLNPLFSTASTIDDADIVVTYQFVDAECFIPQSELTEVRDKSEHQSIANEYISRGFKTSSLTGAKKVARGAYSVLKHSLTSTASHIAANAITSMVGLDKPTSLNRTSIVKINNFHDTASGKGIDGVVKLSMDPENGISTMPNVGGVNADEMMLGYIMGTPTLNNIVTLNASSTDTECCEIYPDDTKVSNSYCDAIGQCFRYWHGSYKIKIYITASLFHNVRLVFYVNNYNVASDWMAAYHKVIQVEGDVEVEMTMPYFAQKFAAANTNAEKWALRVKILSWSQPDPSTSKAIFLNVYKATGEDYKVAGLLDVIIQCNPRKDFTKPFPFFHDSFSTYGQQGFLMGEEYHTLREVMKRYHTIVSDESGSYPLWQPTIKGVEKWGHFFRFYRGSMRYKLLFKEKQLKTRVAWFANSNTRSHHGFTMSSEQNPVLDIETPWYTGNLFGDTSTASSRLLYYSANSQAPVYITNAVGEDFSMHFLRLDVNEIEVKNRNGGIGQLNAFLLS
jgi:hypothetical protein